MAAVAESVQTVYGRRCGRWPGTWPSDTHRNVAETDDREDREGVRRGLCFGAVAEDASDTDDLGAGVVREGEQGGASSTPVSVSTST